MKHLKTFESFSIKEANKFKEFFFGKSEDNDAANEIIERLEKVNPSSNPYEIEQISEIPRYKDHFSGYIIHFDDVDVTTTYYQWSGPGGGFHNEYTLDITPKDDDEYEKMNIRKGLRKKTFKLVDKIYKEQNKKPSVKYGLNRAADLL
jgi:hypothetical protein